MFYIIYILIVLYENNYKIICHTKITIVLWKTIEQNYAFAKEKKRFNLMFIWKKMTENKLSDLWI